MLMDFVKMNGAGNDFVLVDNRSRQIRLTADQVVRLCHRQRGVGADGVVLLVPCVSGKAQWAWDFFNSDGSVAEMCGNASRCFARFIQQLTGTPGPITFETIAGVIGAQFRGEQVSIQLTDPRDWALGLQTPLSDGAQTVHFVNTGVPHAVVFVPDVDMVPLQKWGSEIRFHEAFKPKGTNANFVQVLGPGKIRVRTYERGVEGETLACGTGVTAAALAAARVYDFPSPVTVLVQGGDTLEVSFDRDGDRFGRTTLTGPAEFVFAGSINLDFPTGIV
jgi:diaminopimelate epimerase